MYVNNKQSDKRGGGVGKGQGKWIFHIFLPSILLIYWLRCGTKGDAYILFI